MAIQVQFRGGTTAENAAFTGAAKEVIVDTTKKTLVVHDGSTAGGTPLAKESGSALSPTSVTMSSLTASQAVFSDGSKNLVSNAITGTGNVVMSTSPTLVTPALGTPTSATLTNATGLPISTGVSGLGTSVATALAVNTGSAGAVVVNGGVLGTPSSGTVTNLTGTASININGTVGATTASTGAFTTLSATGVTTVQAGSAAAPAITTSGDTNTGIFFPAADTIAFSEGGVEAARFDSAGNFGLGVTPSAWGSGITAIQLAKDTSVSSHTTGGNLFVNSNTYYNGSNWIYSATRGASQYQQNDAQHIWYQAASGTAGNAITFNQAMTLDASGNLGIGTTSPVSKLTVVGEARVYTGSNLGYWGVDAGNSYVYFGSNSTGYSLSFQTSGSERARIDSSGNLLVGATSTQASSKFLVSIVPGTTTGYATLPTTNTGYTAATFLNSVAGGIGSITTTTTVTLYNTTSDQRLKENIQDADLASSLIDSLKVRQFNWKLDGSHQRYGFVAQELVTIAPEAVHQPTDADEMMAVDYSKLVPMLVKEIQSLRKRLAAAGI